MTRAEIFVAVFCGLALAACGGTKESAPPKTKSDRAVVPERIVTLILDWRPEHRADLEATMTRGLTILHVGAEGIVAVKGCTGPGIYAFRPNQRAETTLQLATPDEIKLTLPTFGAAIAAKLEPELKNGGAIDIALVSVGLKTTTWNRITRRELTGDCRIATHFVRSAPIGAYVVRTGRKLRGRTAGELMNAPSVTGETLLQRAGSMDACLSASSKDPGPPEGCNAVLGIELQKIAD